MADTLGAFGRFLGSMALAGVMIMSPLSPSGQPGTSTQWGRRIRIRIRT